MPNTDSLRQATQNRPRQCLNMVLATAVKMEVILRELGVAGLLHLLQTDQDNSFITFSNPGHHCVNTYLWQENLQYQWQRYFIPWVFSIPMHLI